MLPNVDGELARLVERVCNETMESPDWERLETLLARDDAAKRYYVSYLDLHAHLQWLNRDQDQPLSPGHDAQCSFDGPTAAPVSPLDIVATQPHQPASSPLSGSLLLSYGVAALALGIVLLIAWSSRINHPAAESAAASLAKRPRLPADPWEPSIGRITSALDCQFVQSSREFGELANVSQGQTISLQSGLVEIAYASGARVLLEGPCTFLVDSPNGGYLSRGRLTARIVNKLAGERLGGTSADCFVVRTPTAVVTDLGTEFGVEVEASGASRTQVFLGSVAVSPVQANESWRDPIRLARDESVRVAEGQKPLRESHKEKSLVPFVRQLPQRAMLPMHSTGRGLKEGEHDPHWQIVARSDRPKWSPQAAVVSPIDERFFLANLPTHSQWLSLRAEAPSLPEDTTYTFRTSFDLTGFLPATAVLRGRFLADDHVRAIRLNGRDVPVPPHGFGPFFHWTEFEIRGGFVAGTNRLEIEVLNGGYESGKPGGQSLMFCRVELEGSAIVDWRRKP
mgnify:FL=1